MTKVDDKYRQAVLAYQAGEFDKADRACKQAISAAPQFAPAFYLQGVLALARKDYAVAQRAFKRAVTLDTANPDYHRELIRAYGGGGQMAEAYDAGRAAVAQYPENGALWDFFGHAARERGHVIEAIAAFRRCVAIQPNNAKTLSDLCVALIEIGQLDEALTLLDRVQTLDHGENTVVAVAGAHLAKGNTDRALELINQPLPLELVTPRLTSFRADFALHAELRHAFPLPNPPAEPADRAILDDYTAIIRAALGSAPAPDLFVVFFHVDQPGGHVATLTHDQAADYLGLVALSAKAARRIVPKVKVLLFTDPDTQVPADSGLDHVIRFPFRREWINYERLRADRAFAASGCMTANTLFLDTDVVLNRAIDDVFADDFDIGLTWRGDVPWIPVNAGVILARASRAPQVTAFFDGCLIAYEAMAAMGQANARFGYDIREFQGDQLAMAAYVNWQTPPASSASLTIGETKLRFFPCEDVNCTFKPTLDPAVLAQKFTLHFKGPTKKYARDFVKV